MVETDGLPSTDPKFGERNISPKKLRRCNRGSRGKKKYPVDPTLPNIKHSFYRTYEFMMYSFKARKLKEGTPGNIITAQFFARSSTKNKENVQVGIDVNSHMGFFSLGFIHHCTGLSSVILVSIRRIVCFFAHSQEEFRHVSSNVPATLHLPGGSPQLNMSRFRSGTMVSPHNMEAYSPSSSRSQRVQQVRSPSSRHLGLNVVANVGSEEPDLSWVEAMVTEFPDR
ncbi:OLC1v1036918C1 [Oldenlandia corymbosa var. corymbosa]|uniref:OLC1v1036918C1 n=1 Tax=Oldenlandia corymbosa var. corymbosa TaxID=529605 RepID=A0AAV1CWG9_OLDCO|nr:OLC1v1036918C1 [Oldenlandia corymbosa var. corymbosa]